MIDFMFENQIEFPRFDLIRFARIIPVGFCHFGYIMNELQGCLFPNADKLFAEVRTLLEVSSTRV
jgi:hypothetical protein